jgi:hypothetical protein
MWDNDNKRPLTGVAGLVLCAMLAACSREQAVPPVAAREPDNPQVVTCTGGDQQWYELLDCSDNAGCVTR